jgi:NADPH:quinone reductase-like Zn-dependent oxidoreductase
MRAMSQSTYGKPDVLHLVELPRPVPGAGEVLIAVAASSVNPIDWKRASGTMKLIMPVKFPAVPGYDVSGVIEQCGPGVTGFSVGQRVHARIAQGSGGGSAEFAVAGVTEVAAMPDGLGFAEAAAMPLAGMTALQALRDKAGMPLSGAQKRVLVVGASGGVGHFAVQIARSAGVTVVGVCSARNAALVTSLGATAVVDYKAPNPYAGQEPFDIVLDCVGSDPGPFLAMLTASGCYVSCLPAPANLLRALLNPFSGKKVRSVMLKSNATDLAILDGLYASGKLKAVIDSRFPLQDLALAWERSMSGRSVGKVVVDVATV